MLQYYIFNIKQSLTKKLAKNTIDNYSGVWYNKNEFFEKLIYIYILYNKGNMNELYFIVIMIVVIIAIIIIDSNLR